MSTVLRADVGQFEHESKIVVFDERLLEEKNFWVGILSRELETARLRLDYARPAAYSGLTDEMEVHIGGELHRQLGKVTKNGSFLLYVTLLAALKVCLHKYTNAAHVVVGSPALKEEGEAHRIANVLAIVDEVDPRLSFKQFLLNVRQNLLAAYERQRYPFERVVRDIGLASVSNKCPLFDVALMLSDIHHQLPDVKNDITIEFTKGEEQLLGRICYNRELFEADSIRRLFTHFTNILSGALENTAASIQTLELTNAAERQQLLVEWNDVPVAIDQSTCIHELFEAQAARTPDAIALTTVESQLTYAELEQRSNQLAHYLQGLGVKPEVRVGICVERSIELVVGLLGILKAGGAYVPLDPTYPARRLDFMMAEAGVKVLVTQQRLIGILPPHDIEVVSLDADWPTIALQQMLPPRNGVDPANAAYLIYTSGSTGRPKGVVVSHQAVVNRIGPLIQLFNLDAHSRQLQFLALSFDAMGEEIYPTLASGGAVTLITNLSAYAPAELIAECGRLGVTKLNMTPAYWHQVVDDLVGHQQLVPESVELVVTGGETPSLEKLAQWTSLLRHPARYMNLYGPTEATILATYFETSLTPETVGRMRKIPIGRPLPNTQIYLLDSQLRPVPVGVPGELYIGGASLARGYFSQAAHTAGKFIPDPFAQSPGKRLYRTGDMACYLKDGNIEFLGRRDQQVKLRGYRIELGEIEAALRSHQAVREVIVDMNEHVNGDRRLVAYVVVESDGAIGAADLRKFMSERLPEFMVPASVVLLDAMPLTPVGKIDRQALLLLDAAPPESGANYVAPRTELEIVLCDVWSKVLGVERIGINDDFFRLGGHSLLATQLVSRVRDAFQVDLPLLRLFESPTVASLGQTIDAAIKEKKSTQAPPLVPVTRAQDLPLSFAQQRLWFLDQLASNNPSYNIPTAVRLSGKLNIAALEQTLTEVVRRHEALRTVFPMKDGQPVQQILEAAPVQLAITDLSLLPAMQRKAEAERLIAEEANRPFDLSEGPLLRAGLLRLSEEEHVVLFTLHHIVADGWSMGVLSREVASLYTAFSRGQTSPLTDLPVQYADYAYWQRNWLQGVVLEEQLDYWRQQLADVPSVLELPLDKPRPSVQTFRGATRTFAFSPDLTSALKELSHREGVTLFMSLLAAFKALLHWYSGQSRIVVGTPIANRNYSELENLIGFFVNTLVLSTDVADDPTMTQLLRRVRDTALGAFAHQDLPFERLVEELHPERELSRHPLFQVMFAVQNAPQEELNLEGLNLGTASGPFASDAPEQYESTKFDLSLTLAEQGESLVGSITYNVDLFEQETIKRIVGHYERLIMAMVARPEDRLSALPLLSEEEKYQLLVEWNASPAVTHATKSIHRLFEEQVERTPQAIALIFGDKQISYFELNSRANKVAHHLVARGAGLEIPVGVCMERSIEMVVGLLAVLKAGGVYLPLDPEYPAERLAFMVADSGIPVLLTQRALTERFTERPADVVCIDADWQDISESSPANPECNVSEENLAYLIYTSGSTGRPKAVGVEHRQVVNTLLAAQQRFGLKAEDEGVCLAPTSFDISLFELLSVLLAGGRVQLLRREEVLESERLQQTIGQLTVLHGVPSLMRQIVGAAGGAGLKYEGVRQVWTGGDVVAPELLGELQEVFPQAQVTVLYGPTEAAVFGTSYDVGGAASGYVIGRGIEGVAVRVCDRGGRLVPVGVVGEIWLGGAGVSRGYQGRGGLTAERYWPDEYSARGGARVYRTGDLGRWRADGQLEFVGRVDEQVKVRGQRVELGEVANALREHEAVAEAVVVARAAGGGEQQLVGYVVGRGVETEVRVSELRSYLRRRLPEYMVPGALVVLEAMPLSRNGKIDRRALPAPETSGTTLENTFVAPRDLLEMQLTQLWEEVLNRSSVGVFDNFFDLGGHSLLAVHLIARIQQQFSQKLQLSSLFEEPTVSHQAELLRQRGSGSTWSPLVALQPNGTKHPFFCVHPAGGQVLCYYHLARLLGPDQPFYAWQAPDFDEVASTGSDNYERIEDRAAAYLELMRAVQPEGPYMLGGWSFGGTVAFEIAQQLDRQGQKVALLAQLDAIAPVRPLKLDESLLLIGIAKEMAGQAGKFLSLAAENLVGLNEDEQLDYVLAELKRSGVVAPDVDPELAFRWARASLQGFRLRHQSFENYVPHVYSQQITLLRADLNPMYLNDEGTAHIVEIYQEPTHGWNQLSSQPVKVVQIAGYHETMMMEPYVQVLAEKLKACIREVEVN